MPFKKTMLCITSFLLFLIVACGFESNSYSSIKTVEDIENIDLNDEILTNMTLNHAFIVLGYALSESGEIEDTLLERLHVAKRAANKNENSKIIVTGGVPKNGMTEALVMSNWLEERGIDRDRIIVENQSRNTVENALYSMHLVEKENIESVTIITSASHMRRALLLFLETDKMNRITSHIVHLDGTESGVFVEGEKELIERDLEKIIDLLND